MHYPFEVYLVGKKFEYQEENNFLLTPGNIFWLKSSGEKVLVSKKGEIYNQSLLDKLFFKGQDLLIEDEFDEDLIHRSLEMVDGLSKAIFLNEKILWINRIKYFLTKNVVEKNRSQFELNLIAWNWFATKSTRALAVEFLNIDKAFFFRTFSLASNLTIISFLGGHFHYEYLKTYFENIFSVFIEIPRRNIMISILPQLEEMRLKNIYSEKLKDIVNFSKWNAFFEEPDGVGYFKTAENNMTDIERLEMKMNHVLSYLHIEELNTISMVLKGKMDIGEEYKGLLSEIFNIQVEKEIAFDI